MRADLKGLNWTLPYPELNLIRVISHETCGDKEVFGDLIKSNFENNVLNKTIR